MKRTIKVKVRDTEKVLFEGEVDRISSFNEVGRFDVFPMHANFISILHNEIVLYQGSKKMQEFKVEQAIMKVKQDMVKIFLGMEVLIMEEEITTPEKPQEKVK